jgi:hypothetical protein
MDASAKEEETSKKRKRRSCDTEEVPDGTNPRKKRRRSSATYWGSLSETMASWIAKGMIFFAEWAAQNAKQNQLDQEKDVISLLLHVLDYCQSNDMEILRRGWRVLVACSNTAKEQDLPTTDGIDSDIATVVMAMKEHSSSIKVQLLGCRALRTLVMKGGENWEALCKAGAISVFLRALATFPDDMVMQGLAITFVAMLVREEGEHPRLQTLEVGGVQLILGAMRRFEDEPRLLHTGCYALHQLGFIRRSRSLILSHGGINILLRSVERHMDDVSLVDLCLSALSKLSDEDNLAGHGAVPLIMKSMARWPDEQSIQGHNLVLILRAVGQEPIPHQTSIDLILAAMRKFPEYASLQFFACAALREILQHSRGREALDIISSKGGIECVLNAVKRHHDIFGLQPMALLVLMHIWERQLTEQQTSITAFGGSENTIAMITGMRMPDLNPAGEAN